MTCPFDRRFRLELLGLYLVWRNGPPEARDIASMQLIDRGATEMIGMTHEEAVVWASECGFEYPEYEYAPIGGVPYYDPDED